MDMQIVKYNITDGAIAAMRCDYMALKIDGLDDKIGYVAVKNARMAIKSLRVDVEKTRKELKEESLKYGRTVDAEAKRITEQLTPIEDYLQAQEKAIDDEKARIKEENERARQKITADRIAGLAKLGVDFSSLDLIHMEKMSDAEYNDKLSLAQTEWNQKQVALAEQERLANEDREKQEIERARLEKIAAEQKEIQDKIKADQDKLASERRAFEEAQEKVARAAELEHAKKIAANEAAEKARIETEEHFRRKLKEEEDKARAVVEEQKRLEELRPDAEKLLMYASMIDILIEKGCALKQKTPQNILSETKKQLKNVSESLKDSVKNLTSKARKVA